MKVVHIAKASQEAERFLATVKHWRATKFLTLSEAERRAAANGALSEYRWAGAEQAALRRASLDLTKALATMRQDV